MKYYRELMVQFVEGRLSGKQFTEAYLTSFKRDHTNWDGAVFNVLDAVFGMADCYLDDPVALARVRAESSHPAFWLGDEDLRQGVVKAIRQLKSLR